MRTAMSSENRGSAVGVLFGALAAAFAGYMIYFIVLGFAAPPDPARMTKEPAVVRVVDSDTDEAVVTYDDGIREATLRLRELPVENERVLLERSNGDPKSLWDPVTERRFRTKAWPVRWSMTSFGGPMILLAVALLVVGLVIRELRRPG
jgi:hypothetical protein